MFDSAKISVILVAGGSGNRMGSEIPKQFLLLNGKPVLMHTIENFHNALPLSQCIVVLPANQIAFWNKICGDHQFTLPHEITSGGASRFESVQQGLKLIIPDSQLVLIHDAVRPFATADLINRVANKAFEFGNAIPAIACVDSVREISTDGSNHPYQREKLKMIQTPQGFHPSKIQLAYSKAFHTNFTDDATVLEATGEKIHLVDGEAHNIKITTPFDLELGKLILQNKT